MVRTENTIVPTFTHALVIFNFGSGELKTVVKDISVGNERMG
jgi:hypothetical protein